MHIGNAANTVLNHMDIHEGDKTNDQHSESSESPHENAVTICFLVFGSLCEKVTTCDAAQGSCLNDMFHHG